MTELEKRLEEIKERCKSTTSGPWRFSYNNYTISSEENDSKVLDYDDGGPQISDEDIKFITQARQDIPMLLEMVEVAITPDKHQGDTDFILFSIKQIEEKYK